MFVSLCQISLRIAVPKVPCLDALWSITGIRLLSIFKKLANLIHFDWNTLGSICRSSSTGSLKRLEGAGRGWEGWKRGWKLWKAMLMHKWRQARRRQHCPSLHDFLLPELNEVITKVKKIRTCLWRNTQYLQVFSYPFRILPCSIVAEPNRSQCFYVSVFQTWLQQSKGSWSWESRALAVQQSGHVRRPPCSAQTSVPPFLLAVRSLRIIVSKVILVFPVSDG